MTGSSVDKKELAKPNTKIQVKTFNRDAKGGATQEAIKALEEQKKKEDKSKDIWNDEEVNI
jgi:hypothetical protein